jgi:hypothetical protein
MTQRPSGSRNAGLIVSRLRRCGRFCRSRFCRSRFCRSPEALLRPEVEMTQVSWTPPAVVRANRNESASGGSESGIECPLLPVDMYADLLSVSY